jgi:hypothetical protein
MSAPVEPHEQLMTEYRKRVQAKHASRVSAWPLLSGYNVRTAGLPGGAVVFLFEHTGNPGMMSINGLGNLPQELVGVDHVSVQNLESVRSKLERHFNLGARDGTLIFVANIGGGLTVDAAQFAALLLKHEQAMGLASMKVFLSHKGVDKEMVRRFERLLRELGFDPWLDEDAMPAGVQPDRAIQDGFRNSCAAVFFVTPDFKDEKWLATEIEYARTEKREKGDRFAVITLCLSKDSKKGDVPALLKNFIYKEPAHELDAFREIIRALPLRVGDPRFR